MIIQLFGRHNFFDGSIRSLIHSKENVTSSTPHKKN